MSEEDFIADGLNVEGRVLLHAHVAAAPLELFLLY